MLSDLASSAKCLEVKRAAEDQDEQKVNAINTGDHLKQ